MSAAKPKFCPECGAPRLSDARFCGNCGAAFATSTAPQVSPAHERPETTGQGWAVAVGKQLPDARALFRLQDRPKKRSSKPVETASEPAAKPPKGKSLWGSTLWMSITQGADMMTRAMAGGGPQDAHLELRIGIAAAVAVFGITLRSMPRLRSLLVRLGAIAMALLQGQSLMPVIKETITDPSLISAFAPNLAAQGAGLLALMRLFQTASARVK
jgi:hypothetical protein